MSRTLRLGGLSAGLLLLAVVVLPGCSLLVADPHELLGPPEGIASFYGYEFAGRLTANGEIFNPEAQTAAHPTLPFGTVVEVTRLDTGERILVRINDRGPFVNGRIIDLALGAARELDMLEVGLAPVRLEVVPE